MIGLILFVAIVVAIFGGSYAWARRQGLLTATPGPGPQGKRHISLLTEALGYVGLILILAGGGVAIGQRWHDFGDWGHVGVLAGAAAFFLLVGILVRGVREPAIERLTGVTWFLSVAGAGWAAGLASFHVNGNSGRVTALTVGLAVSLCGAALWWIRRRALQHVALFAGLVITICGAILTIAGDGASRLAFAFALWGFGLAWAALGWLRYLEPLWVAIPLGGILALLALSVAVPGHGWIYAIAIATAAAAMAASVPTRNIVLLALGALAMFGYVTAVVVQYFHKSLGVPAALAITGALIIGLAVVSARLMRVAHPPEDPGAQTSAQPAGPPEPPQPGPERSHDEELPRAR